MGTRSTITFQDDGNTVCKIYQQYDGYIEGVGKELADFLQDCNLVNGISGGQEGRVCNGMGCLAAQFVAEHKDGAGGFYMVPFDADDESYNYVVNSPWDDSKGFGKPGPMQITVTSYGGEIFNGNLLDFGVFVDTYGENNE